MPRPAKSTISVIAVIGAIGVIFTLVLKLEARTESNAIIKAKVSTIDVCVEKQIRRADDIEIRVRQVELEQEKFEGIMEERTRSIQDNVNRIYDIVKDWEQ